MPIHVLKLVDRQPVANNTILLTFTKPEGFQFKPGQYGGFTLINPSETDAGGNTRRFSLLSIPSDNHIAIATRVQNSAYKRALLSLSTDGEIKFAGPTGVFTLHEDNNIPAVFIAGGIGIAPFYSMIRDAAARQSTQKMILFYGNQTLEDTAFYNELMALQQTHTQFQFIPTLVNPPADWQGETGFISHSMIKKYIPDLNTPYYYICGSPVMVTTLQETLAEMDINEDNIRVEDFPGY